MIDLLKQARPLAAAFSLVTLASMPGFAADVVMEEPTAPAAPMEQLPLDTWSGSYAGVSIGYGFSGEADATGNKIATGGFLSGAFVGYNHQMENFVLGAEGDLGYSGVEGENAATLVKNAFEGSLRARLGYVLTPEILLYATAGGAGAQVKATRDGIEDKNIMFGWTADVGTDVKLTDSLFSRVGYRYTDLGSDTFFLDEDNTEISNKNHRIQFSVGMKF